jgi:hypothetical protein
MEASDYDAIPLCNTMYFVKGMGLLKEYRRRRTTDQKMTAVPTPLVLLLYVNV